MKRIELAIVGDIAWNKDITPEGEHTSPGGAVYYSAVGAAKFSEHVGVVARVGKDFDLKLFQQRKIDTQGINVVPGEKTCQFVLTQHSDNTREFAATRGVAATAHTEIFPDAYRSAKLIHLPTQLPQHALTWLDFLSAHKGISVDSFEAFVEQYPELTKQMFTRANMIFTNEAEWQILQSMGEEIANKPLVIKKGKDGVTYKNKQINLTIPAPQVPVVDTSGAGDVMAGAFLAQRAKNVPIETALIQAVETASLSVEEFGVEHIAPKAALQSPHHVSAVVILNEKKQVFLGKTPKFANAWTVPGGHKNQNETAKSCVVREAREELGVDITPPQLLRIHDRYVPEYKELGARFLCHNFYATLQPGQNIAVNREYTEYGFFTPDKAMRLTDLHPTARRIIQYYIQGTK